VEIYCSPLFMPRRREHPLFSLPPFFFFSDSSAGEFVHFFISFFAPPWKSLPFLPLYLILRKIDSFFFFASPTYRGWRYLFRPLVSIVMEFPFLQFTNSTLCNLYDTLPSLPTSLFTYSFFVFLFPLASDWRVFELSLWEWRHH